MSWRNAIISRDAGLVLQFREGTQISLGIRSGPDGLFVDERRMQAGNRGDNWRVIAVAELERS